MKFIHRITSALAIALGIALPQLPAQSLSIQLDDTPIDRSENMAPQSYAQMLEQATPSVVSVHTARIVNVTRGGRGGLSPEEEMLRRFFGLPMPQPRAQPGPGAEPQERRMPQGIGSGVIVSPDGYIITNHHVVSDARGEAADEIQVHLNDGRELRAEIVGSDPLTDVAIIKIEAQNLPAITIADSEEIRVGDVVFAIGNPLAVGLTVTQGIVSAKNRAIGIYGEQGYESFIQTDAAINQGNSGGALIDTRGRLIGINSAIVSRSGGNIGIGFAIPINLAISISEQLVASGEVRRGFLGVAISNLTPDMAEAFDLENTDGVLIDDVEEGSAAEKGGIQRGDVILTVNGKKVQNANDLRMRIGNTTPGTEIEIGLLRGGERQSVRLQVGEASGRFAMSANELFTGVSVAELNSDLAEQHRVPERISGLVITSVEATSPYARHLRPGIVIIEINDRQVNSVSQARERIRSGVNKLYIFENGRTGYLAVRVE